MLRSTLQMNENPTVTTIIENNLPNFNQNVNQN